MKTNQIIKFSIITGIIAIFLVSLLSMQPAHAGKLGKFEKSATGRKDEKEDNEDKDDEERKEKRRRRHGKHGRGWCDCHDYDYVYEPVIYNSITYWGSNSWDRVDPHPDFDDLIAPHLPGDALLPFAGLYLSYQDVDSDVEAVDLRAEFGFGPLAISLRNTHYEEDDPSDELDIVQVHALFRLSPSEDFEIDVGIGTMTIDGEDLDTGLSLTFAARTMVMERVMLEFRPTISSINDTTIEDYDFGAALTIPFLSLRAGYRWLEAGESSLNGPYIGVGVHF